MENNCKPTCCKTDAKPKKSQAYFVPPCDIIEQKEKVTILADLPGVSEGDIDLRVEKNILTLTGNVPEREGSIRYLCKEFRTGSYQRQLKLSDEIDTTKIEATLADGVLRVVLPKITQRQVRKIEVKSV